jgi:hypothetical protein
MDDEQLEAETPTAPEWVARVLGAFELVLYAAIALLLALAAGFVVVGTVTRLFDELDRNTASIDIAVLVLDRVLLALIVGELLYTLRFVLRTHELVVTPSSSSA